MKKGVSGDRNSGFFKKRNIIARPSLDVHITEEEAALAQSNFNVEKITEIQSRFTGGETLLIPGRLFIREGPLWKVCRKNVKKRQFFLFNDILVYGSIVANRCNNQHILPLSKMTASSRCEYAKDLSMQFSQEQLGEGLDAANAFQVSHADKSFHVVASSAADKNNWLSNLLKYIKKTSPQDTVVETRAIWVPDSLAKDCMVCGSRFSAFIRKHHCRKCGRVVCSTCSPHRLDLCPVGGAYSSEERVCNQCFRHQNGHTPSVPPPHPASKVLATPLNTTPLDSPNTSDLEDGSTDTEDTDDSREVEAPPHPQETPPFIKEAPPLTQLACVPSTSLCPPSMEEEKRPTPPPRKKKVKGHSEAAAGLEITLSTIGDVKASLDVPHPPEINEELAVGKEAQRAHRRKNKYFSEGAQNTMIKAQETLSSEVNSNHEGYGTSLQDREAHQGTNESLLCKDPSSGNQETSAGGKDSSPGGNDSSPGGKDSSPGGQNLDENLRESAEPLLERSSSPAHIPSQLIHGSANTRKSARRRQKFVVAS